MIGIVFRKIKNKARLNICLFGGLVLLISMFVCHPLLLRGNESKLLQVLFEDYISDNQDYPAAISRKWELELDSDKPITQITDKMDSYANKWTEYLDVETLEKQYLYKYSMGRAIKEIGEESVQLSLWGGYNLSDHISTVVGENPGQAKVIEDGGEVWYPCFVPVSAADTCELSVGSRIIFKQIKNQNEKYLNVYVAGIIEEKELTDMYWRNKLLQGTDVAWITDDIFEKVYQEFNTYNGLTSVVCYENVLLDHTGVTPESAGKYKNYLEQFYKADSLINTPLKKILTTYMRQARSAEMILFALELPCILLMLLFIYMVISRILISEESEISSWRSRGFKRGQIVWMYSLQLLIVGVFAYVAGIFAGYGICLLAASTNSFLSFVAKDISSYQMIPSVWIYGMVGWLLALVISIPLIWKKSKATIVEVKRSNRYKLIRNLPEKMFLDVILIGIAVYLLVNFEKQRDRILEGILAGKSQDPLIFLSASLFILGCGLLTLRLIKYMVGIIERLGRKVFGAATYAASVQTKRTYEASRILSVFLIMTIASGLFDASLAASIDHANTDRTYYNVGCEVKTSENWKTINYFEDNVRKQLFIEPDYGRYIKSAEAECIESQTRVLTDKKATVQIRREKIDNCVYMGILTDEFGNTASMRDGINEEHWFNALNALAADPDGVIISENMAERLGLKVGSDITYTRYRGSRGELPIAVDGTVVYIVKGFPGFMQYTYEENDDGTVSEVEHYLIVGNYATAVYKFSMSPYEVWYKLKAGTQPEELEAVLSAQGINIDKATYRDEELQRAKDSALIQILNGVFTVSFLLCSIITVVGFLIYWMVSIKARELLLGVYRAMGMHMGEVGGLLFFEIFFCSVLPAAVAVLVGVLTAKLYSGLSAYVCMPEKHIIPLPVGLETDRLYVFAAGIALMGLICFFVIHRVLKSMNIAQALKLGED